jgi:hypothetical protein
MSISATSSAASLMSAIRGQYRDQFAKLKETYQETGSIVGAEASYKSDDGNVIISLRGLQTSDGKEYVDVTYKVDGAEAGTLQRALGYGIDNETGLPVSADTQFGGIGMNASAEIDDLEDFDALAKQYTDMALETPG